MQRLQAAGLVVTLLSTSFVGCSNPAADKPEATVAEAVLTSSETATPESTVATAEVEGTAIPFDGKSSTIGFVGSKIVGGGHDGGFKEFAGIFHVNPETKTLQKVEATIDMNSTWSDNEKLTGHLKNKDFFEVETYPESRFISTKIEAAEGAEASHTVTGDFTLHGVTKSISFPANITVGAEEVTLASEFVLKRGDFDIVYGNVGDNAIRDEVVIKLDLKGTPTATDAGETTEPAAPAE